MKTNNIGLIILATALIFSSCRKGSMWGIRGEGESATETRTLSGFNAIDLSLDANITYIQDSVYSVQVTAQKNILAILETSVSGNLLKMEFKRNVWDYHAINFIIHAPNMNKITISGSGNVDVSNKITGNNLDLNISGSGNISIPSASLQSLNVKLSGSGSVDISDGTCQSEYFEISGSADINSEFFKAENANVKISGSGNITLNASSTLNVTLSGSGDIKYRGQPEIHSDISGSGKLIHLN